MNDIDPQAVIVTNRIVATETFPDEAEFHTAPVDIEAVMLEASLRVRATSFYGRIGPRRSAKPLPASAHLAQVAVIPKATQFDTRTWRSMAIWLTAFAAVSALAAWAAISFEVFR